MAKKQRLDVVLTERGLAPSRARAQALILAHKVRVNDEVASKAGTQVTAASVPGETKLTKCALALIC